MSGQLVCRIYFLTSQSMKSSQTQLETFSNTLSLMENTPILLFLETVTIGKQALLNFSIFHLYITYPGIKTYMCWVEFVCSDNSMYNRAFRRYMVFMVTRSFWAEQCLTSNRRKKFPSLNSFINLQISKMKPHNLFLCLVFWCGVCRDFDYF